MSGEKGYYKIVNCQFYLERKMLRFIGPIIIIIAGLSKQFVFIGTNSSSLLVAFGVLLLGYKIIKYSSLSDGNYHEEELSDHNNGQYENINDRGITKQYNGSLSTNADLTEETTMDLSLLTNVQTESANTIKRIYGNNVYEDFVKEKINENKKTIRRKNN
jgi:hypothetical protein